MGAVFAERLHCTIKDLPRKPVFEKGESKLLDVLPTITKQSNIRIHSSNKLKSIQASLKKERSMPLSKFRRQKKLKAKLKIHDLVRTTDLK